MKGYTDVSAIENYLLIEIAGGFEPQVEEWIEGIENFIDKITGRNFIADATASIKKYDGNGMEDLYVDEFVGDVESVKIDDVEIDEDNYLVYPANSEPKTRINLKSGLFTEGGQNIEVEAKWGYSAACPADIKFAATVFMSGIINFAQSSGGEIKSESIGQYSITFKDDKKWDDFDRANKILSNYIKITF